MTKKGLISIEELKQELTQDSEFRKADRKIKPFYDLVSQIIDRRNQLGLSQVELAERAGTFQSRISKIESAEFDVRLSTLIEIAEALNTELKIQMEPIVEISHTENYELFRQLFKTTSVVLSSNSTHNNPVTLTIK